MGLWKITDKGPTKIAETRFKQEKLLEENLEDWISADPAILGEPLLVIGCQVLIPDTKDRLDLLAVDPSGAAVIIELKRGLLKDPVDIQALRYASYIAKWQFEDFENVARNYLGKVGDPDFNFNALFESFCEEAGVEEVPDLNEDQRIVIIGSAVRDKLGSVALWLREHSVDIKLIEVQAYKEGESVFIQPTVVVPVQVSKFTDVGRPRAGGNPWITDGRMWHLERRCSPTTKQMLLTLDKVLHEHVELEGPIWNQKHYVAYRANVRNWLYVSTRSKSLILDFVVQGKIFQTDPLAKQLGVAVFDREETLSEKLNLPSSVYVRSRRNENTDRVRIRAKEDFNLQSPAFIQFLEAAYKACPK